MVNETELVVMEWLPHPRLSSRMSSSNTLIHENSSSNYAFPASPSEKDRSPDKNFLPATPSGMADSPRSPHHPAVTPLLNRGRMLNADELLMDSRPVVVDSPGRSSNEFPYHNLSNTAALQRLLSPNASNTRMMPQRNPHTMMDASSSSSLFGGDSPLLQQQHPTNNHAPTTMMWGSDMGGVRHPGEKPKRPLSAYNFYFQLERERIISSDESDRHLHVTYTEEDVQRLTLMQARKADQPKEKRSHRKTHGKISFGDLARTIANKWKQLAAEDKEIFEGSAAQEKERYRKELAEWNKQMKKWKDAAAKMTSSLQYQSGALNLSSEATTPGLMNHSIVTPDQISKKTVYPPSQESHADHMLQAMAQQQRLPMRPHASSNRRSTFPGARGLDFGGDAAVDLLHPLMMNEGLEDDFYPHHDGGVGDSYTDEITEETYRMAQMMLPPPHQNRVRRSPVQQRRMKMLLLMQQRYRRQQMMLMQMNQQLPNEHGDLYGAGDPMDEMPPQPPANDFVVDQLDDANFLDHHFLMQQQLSRGRPQQRPRVEELYGGGGLMDDPFAQNMMQQQMGNILHAGTFDDRV